MVPTGQLSEYKDIIPLDASAILENFVDRSSLRSFVEIWRSDVDKRSVFSGYIYPSGMRSETSVSKAANFFGRNIKLVKKRSTRSFVNLMRAIHGTLILYKTNVIFRYECGFV